MSLKHDELQMFLKQLKLAEKTNTRISLLIRRTILEIEEEINNTYYRYKERYNLTDEEMLKYMKKKLTNAEIEKYVAERNWALADITSMKNRVTQLSLLKNYIAHQTNYIAQESTSEVEKLLKFVIEDTHSRNFYNICKNGSFEIAFQRMPKEKIDKLLHHNWLDSNFYKRIQHNCGKLQQQVEEVLTSGVLKGSSPQKMAEQLTKCSNYGIVASERLVRTETAHFHNKVEGEQYEELGIEKYIFLATLDGRTCTRQHKNGKSCAELDGKVFKTSDRKEGENYPPVHPNCRCNSIIYLDEETKNNLMRRAKTKDGKPVVFNYKTYEEWAKDNL